jgi:hypothetical protein
MVELRYDMKRVEITRTGFNRDFAKVLLADLEHAVKHVLKLNEWHEPLSTKETRFVLFLPDPALRLVHRQHLDEAIENSIRENDAKNTKNALRLIRFRETSQTLTVSDYDKLLNWSLKYNNRTVFDYVKKKSNTVDIYMLNLADLAENESLFKLNAPKILKKIYKTMDKTPKPDGTTLGRIDDLLTSHNPDAVLYVLKTYDFEDEWMDVSRDGRTLLMAVCEGGNLEAAKYLVENKRANIHAQTTHSESTMTLFGQARVSEGRLSPVFYAAKSGNSELITYLASKGANVNSKSGLGATPLMHAVSANQLDATKTLISLGAQVNATMNSPQSNTSGNGYQGISTAYRRALRSGNQKMIEVLTKAGAKP